MDFEPLVVNCTEKQCRYLVNECVCVCVCARAHTHTHTLFFFNLAAGLTCCAEFSKVCSFLYCCWEQSAPGNWCWILHI